MESRQIYFGKKLHFVTGRLAAKALEAEVAKLSEQLGFGYSIQVLPITVAALLTPQWIAARIEIPVDTDEVLLPGYARGDLSPIQAITQVPVRHGPKDLRDLGQFLGGKLEPVDLSAYDIEIIAEINLAPTLDLNTILAMADSYRQSGADVIDVGCVPNSTWQGVGDCVLALRDAGHRVSIDSLDKTEIGLATAAGAELVLSVNATNRVAAQEWGATVVVIPESPSEWVKMEDTIEFLEARKIRYRIDPILEPIGFGFSASISRYQAARLRWPTADLMMGTGNITEMSDVDSAGINFLLMAVCQELKIFSVLTTEVINWARSSVRECDIARRIVKYSIDNQVPPKHLSDELICMRDSRLLRYGSAYFRDLQKHVRDRNYRVVAEDNLIHVLGLEDYFVDGDPFKVFDSMQALHPKNVDPSHAFYLGYELCKAEIANQLGKQYTQDEPLNWGHLTEKNLVRHRLKRRNANSANSSETNDNEQG